MVFSFGAAWTIAAVAKAIYAPVDARGQRRRSNYFIDPMIS
jgi:hypothetical protein